jgi:RND family efflux transporter MFP subunit
MPDESPDEPPHRHSRRWLVLLVAAAIVSVAFVLGLLPRLERRAGVRDDTAEMAVPTVSVVTPKKGEASATIVLPGNTQAFNEAPIFSRASGYLARWYVDIGGHVKQGQLLAVIAIPEVDHQLEQARSTLAMAKANLQVAQATAARFTELQPTKAVSQQEVDNAVGAFRANQATVDANQATVQQLEQSVEYARIRAPFDGVITVRNVDVGDLINAGSSTTPNTELFHIVQADKLRVYVSVPEAFAPAARPNLTADVSFIAMPGRTFKGTLVRTARAIDPTTRTLNAELEVDNADGVLFAGSFCTVRLTVPARASLTLPVETLLFRRDGLRVATVAGGKVAIKNVTPGHDFGETIEVTDGLRGDEQVIQNPSDSIADGQEVKLAPPKAKAAHAP